MELFNIIIKVSGIYFLIAIFFFLFLYFLRLIFFSEKNIHMFNAWQDDIEWAVFASVLWPLTIFIIIVEGAQRFLEWLKK